MTHRPKVSTCLWFDGNAEEAVNTYVSLIPDSRITSILRVSPDAPALLITFTLGGASFQALNGGPQHELSEAVSISVSTKDQEETDRLWAALTADGGRESACSWLEDRFGLSWQIVPEALPRLLGSTDPVVAGRAMKAMMGMRKIDIAALEAAARGE